MVDVSLTVFSSWVVSLWVIVIPSDEVEPTPAKYDMRSSHLLTEDLWHVFQNLDQKVDLVELSFLVYLRNVLCGHLPSAQVVQEKPKVGARPIDKEAALRVFVVSS